MRSPHPKSDHGSRGTWLEPEELAYTARAGSGGRGTEGFSGGRRCRALCCHDGKLRVFNVGIPDTYFSLPVRGGGWVGREDGVYEYHPCEDCQGPDWIHLGCPDCGGKGYLPSGHCNRCNGRACVPPNRA